MKTNSILHLSCALFGALATFAFGSTPALSQSNTDCGEYNPQQYTPFFDTYAAPWNVFSNVEEMMMRVSGCNTGTAQVEVGLSETKHYVWSTGHIWKTDKWEPITYSKDIGVQQFGNWIDGTANHKVIVDEELRGKPVYIVSYQCQFKNEKWNCGCSDAESCSEEGKWLLQRFDIPTLANGDDTTDQNEDMNSDDDSSTDDENDFGDEQSEGQNDDAGGDDQNDGLDSGTVDDGQNNENQQTDSDDADQDTGNDQTGGNNDDANGDDQTVAPAIAFNADPTQRTSAGQTLLRWAMNFTPDTCTANSTPANNEWVGTKPIGANQQYVHDIRETTNFSITCQNAAGETATSTARVTIGSGDTPFVDLQASSTVVAEGQDFELSWTTRNMESCAAFGAWSGEKNAGGGNETHTKSASGTMVYRLSCIPVGGGNGIMDAVEITDPTNDYSIDIEADRQNIAAGENVGLSWNTTGVQDCIASGHPDFVGSVPSNIQRRVINNITETTIFTITCDTNQNPPTISDSVRVEIAGNQNQAASLDFEVSSPTVTQGESIDLTWNGTGLQSCIASGRNTFTGSKTPGKGFQKEFGISEDTTFRLSCSPTNGGNEIVREVTVSIDDTAPTANLSVNPVTIARGTGTTAIWFTENVTSCTASGGWTGEKATAGINREPIDNIDEETELHITCTGPGGTVKRTAFIHVQ